MKKILLIILFLYLFCPSYCYALWTNLNKDQINEAIEYGKNLSNKLGPDSGWSVRSDRATGWVELTTPFSAVAKLAREYSVQSKTIRDRDIKRAISPHKGKLIFNYYHYDIEEKFSLTTNTEYFAMIRTPDNRIIYPLRYEKGTESIKRIDLEFSFLLKNIDPDSIIYLIVREPSGYEQEFIFDLGKIH